jgi:[acyl-carrier-protein] S-malonyltransferase
MGRDLLEQDDATKQFLLDAEERLKLPLKRLMLDGPEAALQATEAAQPAILFHSLALLRALSARADYAAAEPDVPAAVAGHSLGEFAGLVAAGGLDPLDALTAVQARGRAMATAAPSGSGMVAVLGLDDRTVEAVCAGTPGVVPANFNAPGQVVISGSDEALAAASRKLQAAGARRLVRLSVSGAFHSPLMDQAARTFATAWERIPLRPLSRPQVFNADADVHTDPIEVRTLLVAQLTGPVRWSQTVRRLASLGVHTFVEIGPKRTLTALVRKILPSAVVHNIEDVPSLTAYLETPHAG